MSKLYIKPLVSLSAYRIDIDNTILNYYNGNSTFYVSIRKRIDVKYIADYIDASLWAEVWLNNFGTATTEKVSGYLSFKLVALSPIRVALKDEYVESFNV
jgi:hypothetical protein